MSDQPSPPVALRALEEPALPPPARVRPAWLNFAVMLGPEAVGTCGLLFREDGGVEIGYRIEPQHRRKGCARAALARLIGLAFDEFGLAALDAEVAEDNIPSLALLARLGFIDTKKRREQWSQRRNAYISYQLHRLDRGDWIGTS